MELRHAEANDDMSLKPVRHTPFVFPRHIRSKKKCPIISENFSSYILRFVSKTCVDENSKRRRRFSNSSGSLASEYAKRFQITIWCPIHLKRESLQHGLMLLEIIHCENFLNNAVFYELSDS